MKTDISYEVSDFREGIEPRLGPVGALKNVQGGITISTNNGVGLFVDLELEEPDGGIFEDRDEDGVIVLNMPEGHIVCTRLGLGNYRSHVYPYLAGDPGPFATDAAVNRHFFRYLTEKM